MVRMNKSAQVGITAIILVLALLVVALFFYSGMAQQKEQEWGLAGFHVSVPVTYYIQYTSKDNGGDVYDSQTELMEISAGVDSSAIVATPIYLVDFNEISADWVGESIPTLHNQDFMVDESSGVDGFQEPDPDNDFVQSTAILGEDGGHQVYCGGRWSFQFLSSDGSTVYTKTIRNVVLLQIPIEQNGVTTYELTTIIHVYIPVWRLPDESGPMTLNCLVDYDLQAYSLTHNWDYGAVWNSFAGDGPGLIDRVIDNLEERIEGYWSGVGEWYVKAAVVGIALISLAAFPLMIPGILTAGVLLTAYIIITDDDGQEQEVPAVRQKGYDNPRSIKGFGQVQFQIVLEAQSDTERLTDSVKRRTGYDWFEGEYFDLEDAVTEDYYTLKGDYNARTEGWFPW